MLHGDANLGHGESFAALLQGLHSKLDQLAAGQHEIAICLGVSLEPGGVAGNHLEENHADGKTGFEGGVDSSKAVKDCGDDNIEALRPCDNEPSAHERHVDSNEVVKDCVDDNIEAVGPCVNQIGTDSGKISQLRDFTSDCVMPAYSSKERTPRSRLASFGTFRGSSDGGGGVSTKIMQLLPLHRYSNGVLFVNLVGVLIMFKDSVQVPYTVVYKDAWHHGGSSTHLFVMSIVSATFWTLDLMLRFVISTEEDDDLKHANSVKFVAMRYLKSWLIVDLILAILDWLNCVVEAAEDNAPTVNLKFTKVLQVSRIVRIVAVVKAKKVDVLNDVITHKLRDHQVPQLVIDFMWKVSKLFVFVAWVNHLGACAWIFIEMEAFKGANHWGRSIAQLHVPDARSFADTNLSQTYKYAIAYYWSLTTMLSGESFLDPMTIAECWFATAYSAIGLLTVTSIISSTSALLLQINQKTQERMAELRKLWQFLRQRKISSYLSLQIQHQARERSEMQTRLAEQEVSLLSCLSAELRDQLRLDLYAPLLRGRPLWRACNHVDHRCIGALCLFATSAKMCAPGEIVFEEGSHVDDSWTLMWGSMKYSWFKQAGPNLSLLSGDGGENENYGKIILVSGDTACENALWSEWKTVGFLEALTTCELLVCSSKGLAIVMEQVNSAARKIMRGYAKAVLDFTILEQDTHLSDVSTYIDYDSIVSFMPAESRLTISMPALEVLRKRNDRYTLPARSVLSSSLASPRLSPTQPKQHGLARKNSWTPKMTTKMTIKNWTNELSRAVMSKQSLVAIEQEVIDGKCFLGQDESDTVFRIIRVAVLTLRNADGLICVEVGEVREGVHKTRIRLPGRKLRMRETLKECAQQVIHKHFAAFESRIRLSYGKVDVDVKPSKAHSIPTKYIRLAVDAFIQRNGEGLLAGTAVHHCAWGDAVIQCFAWLDSDDLSVVIYAWMTPDQYEDLNASGKEGEALVASWMAAFTATEIEHACRSIFLL